MTPADILLAATKATPLTPRVWDIWNAFVVCIPESQWLTAAHRYAEVIAPTYRQHLKP